MDRTIGSCMVKTFYEMFKRDKVVMDYIKQRDAGQWNNAQKSKLMTSIILGFDIPSLYFVKEPNEKTKTDDWVVIDGVQRLTTVFSFMENDFKLAKNTPPVVIGGNTYEIAGKKFKQLDDQLKEIFTLAQLDTKYLINYTEEELDEQFYRLNNGSIFTKQQKAMIRLSGEILRKLKTLKTHAFWNRVKMTKSTRVHGGVMDTLLRCFIMIMGYDYGSSITAEGLCKFADYFNVHCTDEIITNMEKLFDKLERVAADINDNMGRGEALNSFLTQNNIPTIIQHLNEYQQVEGTYITEDTILDEQRYGDFLATIAEGVDTNGYLNYCGTKSSNREKVEGRIEFFRNELKAFNDLDIELYNEDIEEEKALNKTISEEVENNDTRASGVSSEAIETSTFRNDFDNSVVQREQSDVPEFYGVPEIKDDSESHGKSSGTQGQMPASESNDDSQGRNSVQCSTGGRSPD